MDSKDFWKIIIISFIVAVIVSLIMSQITGRAVSAPQCRDRIDNDGDAQIDYPKDSGCSGKQDTTEASCVSGSTNCGVGACERISVCVNDAVSCTPGSPTTEVCNGIDDNCNGLVDDGGVCSNGTNWTG